MKWTKISLTTTTAAVDLVSALFDEIGLEGIQIEDHVPLSEEDKKAMYIDILPDIGPDDGKAVVSSYVEPEKDIHAMLKNIEEGLLELRNFVEIGEGVLSVSETDDRDWINNWKEFFKPFYVAEDMIIKPTWEELTEKKETDIVLEIDPGTAFGTGAHETTRLCMEGIRKYTNPDTRLLDVGCGSGILSIAAIKSGALFSYLTDIDAEAVKVAEENLRINGIGEESYQIALGDLITEEELGKKAGWASFDIVAANILADVIIPLSAVVGKYLKPNGVFISSGIIISMKEEVEKALLKNGFMIVETNVMGDWVSFVARKDPDRLPIKTGVLK